MAITNAQQYKQLLAKGGRIGFKGGADMGTVDATDSKGNVTRAATAKSVSVSPSGSVRTSTTRGPDPVDDRSSALQTYNTKVATGKLGDEDYETFDDVPLNKREQELKKFLEKRNKVKLFGLSKIFTGPAQKFSDFNASINRPFFKDVIRAGKIPGLSFDATADELEKAYQNYMSERLAGNIDAYGNPLKGNYYDSSGNLVVTPDDGPDQPIIPTTTPVDPTTPTTPTPTRNLGGLATRFAGSIFDFTGLADGGRVAAMDGGIMNTDVMGGAADGNLDEMGRQMYFLGKLVKKATRAVKKVAKSPIGKAALAFGAYKLGAPLFGKGSFFGTGFNPLKDSTKIGPMSSGLGKFLSKFGISDYVTGDLTLGGKLGLGFGIPFALDMLGVGKDDDKKMDLAEYYKTQGIDIDAIRNSPYRYLTPATTGSKFNFADGGRTGYQEGGDAEPVAKKTMPLIDMDGKEKDYRETGGFVDMGRMERADDVPARLSKNEFVFTADAVRNAGEGDIDKGAEVMYNMMKNLEAGGEVSEESQGLEGAREMFKTSQRLGEVI